MTQQQKITAGILALLAIILIAVGVSRNNDRAGSEIENATSTEMIGGREGGYSIILPETDNQEVTIIDGQGEYKVAPMATVPGKITIGDTEAEAGDYLIRTVYQDPGLDSTYTWLVLFDGEDVQKSNFLVGENVIVTDLEVSEGATGVSKVTISYEAQNGGVSKKTLVVSVRNGVFDPATVVFPK